MPGRFDPENVCAVMVTYFPDAALPERLRAVSGQADRVIVVDNGTSGPESVALEAAGTGAGVTLLRNPANVGVAAALNRGVRAALSRGYPWVLLLDQDSEPTPRMVEAMISCWEAHTPGERPMLMGPRTEMEHYAGDDGWGPGDGPWKEVPHVITSGSLIPAEAFHKVGGFLESLFIDYVDIEYCLRLRSRGFKVVQVRDAVLRHRLGRIEQRRLFRRTVHPSHHDPLRRYYQFRNAVLVQRAYKRADARWCRRNRVVLVKILFLLLRYEDQRMRKCRHILRGLRHGMLGRAGREGEARFGIPPV